MITVRYKNVILNGLDKSGKVETVPDQEGHQLVSQGYAEVVRETAVIEPPISQEIKRKKKWRSK